MQLIPATASRANLEDTALRAATRRAGAGCAGLAAFRPRAVAKMHLAVRAPAVDTALRAAARRAGAGCAGPAATRQRAAARMRRAFFVPPGHTALRAAARRSAADCAALAATPFSAAAQTSHAHFAVLVSFSQISGLLIVLFGPLENFVGHQGFLIQPTFALQERSHQQTATCATTVLQADIA